MPHNPLPTARYRATRIVAKLSRKDQGPGPLWTANGHRIGIVIVLVALAAAVVGT